MKPWNPVKARHAVALGGIAAVCAVVAGCVGTEPVRAAEPPILCESSYSNFAWTPTLMFTGIGEDGRIYRFSSQETTDLQGFALLDLALPERPRAADIARRYVISSPTGEVVPPDVLQRIAALAAEVRDGAVTREQRGADMGQSTLACFVPVSEGSNLFDNVVISSDGDWEERNTDPAAAELAELLTSLLAPAATEPPPQ
jgi:hypothetical protein